MLLNKQEPNAITPNHFSISIAPKYISPCMQMVTKPTASIILVRITEDNAADIKYEKIICPLLSAVARML